jgi:hypothetical protein
MARRPPLKPAPKTPDKLAPKPNKQAIEEARLIRESQVPVVEGTDAPATPGSQAYRSGDTGTVTDNGMPSTFGSEVDGGYRELKTSAERHEQRMEWFYSEASRQAANRRLMARDEAIYDNQQWDREDAQVLEERGQKPIVYNEVAPTIDWLIGTERRSRVDFYVVSEDDGDGPAEEAIAKTKLLKWLEDTNKGGFERSEAAEDAFKAGLGILELGLRHNKQSGPPVFIGHVPWREFLHDSRAKKDQSDARHNFRIKEVDLDVAIAMFPQHEALLKRSATAGDSVGQFRGMHNMRGVLGGLDAFSPDAESMGYGEYDGTVSTPVDLFNARERVCIIECWSREPVRQPSNAAGLGDPVTFKVRVSLMVEEATLLEVWSPFKHDRFPFILHWAYRSKATGMPYSPIRRLVGPQQGLNRRMARSLFEASFNQMELEEAAISEKMNLEELHAEANDPNGVLIFANGALSGQKVRQRQNPGAAREQILLAEADRAQLRAMSGVNEENRGLHSAATSRVAMDAKAERGSVQTAALFDELLLARQQEGELALSLCEQFVRAPMTIGVAGDTAAQYERVKINEPSHYELDEATGEVRPVYLNDITARRAHFIVGEQAWKQSYAEAAFASLMEVLTQLATAAPQVVVALLDVVFDMHPNLPKKKAVLARIRSVNGQTDPDGKMSPEQAQAQQQKAAMAQAQFELQMAQLRADVQVAQAKGEALSTEAMLKRVTALYEAAQTAQVLALAPGVAPIADQVLASSGFTDLSGSPNTIDPAQVAAATGLDTQEASATTTQGRMRSLAGPMGAPSGGMPPPGPPGAGVGEASGIETARPDGVRPGVPQ